MNVLRAPLEVTILGVSATGPTKDRNVSAIYGRTYQQSFLLDVGQNCQKRIMESNLDLMVDFIVISHKHTDHCGGLGPLLKTMYRMQRKNTLNLYVSEQTFFRKYLALVNANYDFVNIIQIRPELKYCQKDLYLEFFHRTHGLNEVPTYGVKITSSSEVKYDKTRLQKLKPEELSVLFKTEVLTTGDKTYHLEDFVVSDRNLINFYYTSDGLYDENLIKHIESEEKHSLLITECTHYHSQDVMNSYKTEHTHFNDLLTYFKNFKKQNLTLDCTLVLVHLGEKLTDRIATNLTKKHSLAVKNVHFGFEGLVLAHDYRNQSNLLLRP